MGSEIVYCSVCGDRILESEFNKGRAVTVLKKNYCSKCAKNVVKANSGKQASGNVKTPIPRKLETRRVPLADKPVPPPWKLPIPVPYIVAIAIGTIVVILFVVVWSRSR